MTNSDDDDGGSEGAVSSGRAALEAKAAMTPHLRHGLVAKDLAGQTTGFESLQWAGVVDTYADRCADTRKGDLGSASNLLTSQAMTLDTVFTEMLRRAVANCGDYPEAADRYMRMAMKAQAQSRATLEALAKMHQPREQTVKHIHIDNRGGQAVVTDTVQAGGTKTENADQSYGPAYSGAFGPSLFGEDEAWHGVPVPGAEGQEAVPYTRRQSRSAARE
jgi:hypothetical protein